MRIGDAEFFQYRRTAAANRPCFSEDEDKVGAPPVAIISDRFWQRVFNAIHRK